MPICTERLSTVCRDLAPQGVVLSHSNVCATMAGLVDAGDFTNKDVYLAYLPLAHIMAGPSPGIQR